MSGSSDFAYVEQLYSESMRKLRKKKVLSNTGKVSVGVFRFISVIITGFFQLLAFIFTGIGKALSYVAPDLPRIAVIVGWLIGIFTVIPLCLDVGYCLLLLLLFIVGSLIIPLVNRGKTFVPLLVTIIGMILSIVKILPSCDDVGYMLALIVNAITAISILIRSLKKKAED